MASRWNVGQVTGAVAIGALVAGSLAPAASARPSPPPPLAGHVAFVAKNQAVRIVTIAADGTTSGFQTIGPVTPPAAGQTIRVEDLVASGDGNWVAWDEVVTKGHGARETFTTVLALRDVVGARTFHRTSGQFPVGFAGPTLVTTNGTRTEQVGLQPSFHFVRVPNTQYPMGTYAGGVIDVAVSQAPAGPRHTDRLRLTSLTGHHTVLHSYVLGRNQYNDPDDAWTSGDGKRLVIERGNHQDFGGLGPSSLVDSFNLGSHNARQQLDHYGTAAAQWRVAAVSFAGAGNTVWAAWERATRHGATGVIATFSGGNWQRTATDGIAVAGNSAGYVIEQQGTFVSVNKEFPDYQTVPSHGATLRHGSASVPLDIEGNAFVWVS